jgi:hypothetical protein
LGHMVPPPCSTQCRTSGSRPEPHPRPWRPAQRRWPRCRAGPSPPTPAAGWTSAAHPPECPHPGHPPLQTRRHRERPDVPWRMMCGAVAPLHPQQQPTPRQAWGCARVPRGGGRQGQERGLRQGQGQGQGRWWVQLAGRSQSQRRWWGEGWGRSPQTGLPKCGVRTERRQGSPAHISHNEKNPREGCWHGQSPHNNTARHHVE